MADPVSAGIMAGASLLGGVSGKKGASKAARIQAQAYNNAIAEQRNEFNTIQGNERPYMTAGTKGLDALTNLLGLGEGGLQGQSSAIDALKASPLFTSQYGTGVNTILQNAAATGGLRGGNVNNSLAQFGSGLLSNVIQNQLANYSGLAGIGQAAAAGSNAGAISTGNNISNLTAQQGSTAASYGLAGSQIGQNTISGLGSALAQYLSANGGTGLNSEAQYNAAYGWGQ